MKKIVKLTESDINRIVKKTILSEAGPDGLQPEVTSESDNKVTEYLESLQKQINNLKTQLSKSAVDVEIPVGAISVKTDNGTGTNINVIKARGIIR